MSSVLNMQLWPVRVEHCSTDRHWMHVKSLQRCECFREEWRMHLSPGDGITGAHGTE